MLAAVGTMVSTVAAACSVPGMDDATAMLTPTSLPLAAATTVAEHHAEAPHYGYEGDVGPEHWADMLEAWKVCETGTQQSPIDLTNAVVATDEVLPDMTFNYGTSNLNLFNNGHTVQAAYDPGSTLTLGSDVYTLAQFHFHAHSEHVIDGEPTPLELHLMHSMQPTDGSAARLAVVGVLITEGAEHPAFAAVMDHLPSEVTEEPHPVAGVTVDANAMLPADRTFYHYSGSLTTPGCTEGVAWQVLTTPIELSADQIAAFTALHDENFRPLQPIGERELQVSGP